MAIGISCSANKAISVAIGVSKDLILSILVWVNVT
jgi:hypothetical protein